MKPVHFITWILFNVLFGVIQIFLFFSIDLLRQYLTQIRQETGIRLVEKVFSTADGKPSKWWTCFAKKRFMEHSLAGFGQ